MTNTRMLDDIIKNSGYKYSFIAMKLGISYQAFRNKLTNKTEFLPTEIEELCRLLGITDLRQKNDIFFYTYVDESSTCNYKEDTNHE